ncbi:MAG: hypothetical protein R6U98_22825 [Pirellulaceae bacterium]
MPPSILTAWAGFQQSSAGVRTAHGSGCTSTARTTADTGEQGVWDGEAPVVNRLERVGHLAAKTPYYNVMLNGETVHDVRLFQQPLPSGATVGRVQLQALNAPGNWLANTVALTPGPASEEIPSPKLLAGFLKLKGLTKGLLYPRPVDVSDGFSTHPPCSVPLPPSRSCDV